LRPTFSISDPALMADKARAEALCNVSRETWARLDRFVALLLQWQAKRNLVAAAELPRVWTRHVADSLQLLRLAPNAQVWVDFGSGGGFPGIPIACALADKPGASVRRSGSRKSLRWCTSNELKIVGTALGIRST
jgi:16S rRNA (guanine527-N7)-methyltransferase